jgi:Ser/Thr protein kinase RdoA (MazF antagonist)
VRTRGPRTSSDAAVAFDHGLRRHLVAAGVPTTAPVPARDGVTAVRLDGRVHEVFPFVAGLPFDDGRPQALANAARALARFHAVASSYPMARSAPPLAQYATLGIPDASDRMEDPALLARVYGPILACRQAQAFGDAVVVTRRWLDRLGAEFGRAAHDQLPAALTHGDYTRANLLFDRQDRVVGIFDFDWAPRVRDLGDGLYFLSAVRRSPLRPDDIWSLTEMADFQVDRCVAWLRAYVEVSPLLAIELAAVPLAFAARWLSIRAEGMAKVPEQDRLRFCLGPIAEPLQWIESFWPQVAARCAS